ncbi:metal ABC transporter permease, partial [Staphylococcus chromogenes]
IMSIVIGEFSVIAGLITAFYLDISPGGVIVVILILLLGLTFLLQKVTKGAVKRSEY